LEDLFAILAPELPELSGGITIRIRLARPVEEPLRLFGVRLRLEFFKRYPLATPTDAARCKMVVLQIFQVTHDRLAGVEALGAAGFLRKSVETLLEFGGKA